MKVKLIIIIAAVLFNSCVKTEALKDEMTQTFSIPLGEKELKIDAPTIIDNSSNFYYNGKPYRIVDANFQKTEMIDFEMDSITKNDIIQGADFRIKFENSYPVNASLQIYLLDDIQLVTDSFFLAGMQKLPAGEVNSLSEPEIITTTILDTEFHGERLNRLKSAKYLKYMFYLESSRDDGAILKFTNKSSISVTLAMRLYLKYNLSEI